MQQYTHSSYEIKNEDRTMMFPDDDVGMLYVGPLFSHRGKKVTAGLSQPKVRVLSRFKSSA